MKRAGKVKWSEVKVGGLIAVGILFMLYASFRGGGTSIFERKNDYITYCSDLEGLAPGAPVWLAGVEVGNVNKVSFLKHQVEEGKNIEVRIRVKKSVEYLITPGTIVQLGTIGLLGDKYVKLVPGPPSDTTLDDGSIIPSTGVTGLDGVLREMPKTLARLNNLLDRAAHIVTTIDTGSGTISLLIKNRELAVKVSNLVDRSDNLMVTLDKNSSTLTKDFHAISSDFHALSEELLAGKGTIGQLLRDPKPYENIVSATARLDTLLMKVEQGEGTAGQLVNDQELYDNIKDLMARMNTLVKDLMDNPKKYFKFSVF